MCGKKLLKKKGKSADMQICLNRAIVGISYAVNIPSQSAPVIVLLKTFLNFF